MAFGKFFIPPLIVFNSLTRHSFKSVCMSVTGLKIFESSYCVLKSPTRSDKKLCWMFCLALRNSLTIKSLFLGSVIFRNDMFLLAIFLIFSNMVLNMVLIKVFNVDLNMILNMVLNMVLKMVFEYGFLTWFRIQTQVGKPILFPRNNSLASNSIFELFQGSS